jgi:hypothetical protein
VVTRPGRPALSVLPGPAFWSELYGIDSYDEFNAKIGRYLPGPSIFGVSLDPAGKSGLAYQDPGSALGLLAISVASIRGIQELSDTQLQHAKAIADSAIQQSGARTVVALVIPNCFQVAIKGSAGGHDVLNVVGVQNSSGTAAAAAAAVKAAWEVASGPLARLSSLYSMVSYTATDIGTLSGAIAVVTSSALGGVVTTNSFATAGACALIKWNGSSRAKSSRGRLYLGPIMEADINPDGRTLVSGSATNFGSAMSNMRTSLSGAGYPLVVLSRKTLLPTTVTSSAVETTIGTQRRRIRS